LKRPLGSPFSLPTSKKVVFSQRFFLSFPFRVVFSPSRIFSHRLCGGFSKFSLDLSPFFFSLVAHLSFFLKTDDAYLALSLPREYDGPAQSPFLWLTSSPSFRIEFFPRRVLGSHPLLAQKTLLTHDAAVSILVSSFF